MYIIYIYIYIYICIYIYYIYIYIYIYIYKVFKVNPYIKYFGTITNAPHEKYTK